jgi:dienelactone hydrolase
LTPFARRLALIAGLTPLFVLPATATGHPITAGRFARAEVAHYAKRAHRLGRANAPVIGVDYADCVAPAGDPAPGTAAWQQRDAINQYCATLRLRDQYTSPAYGNANSQEGNSLYLAQLQEQAGNGPGHIHGGFTTLIPGSQAADAFRALDRWEKLGIGVVKRITFTASDGAVLRGHVFEPLGTPPASGWPGVVITDGSIQAFEQLYYWAAEDLVAHGYEVMTYDVQGQGDSDLLPAGCPSQSTPVPTNCQGVPYQQSYNFFQGAEDSLNWFDSPANPYYAQLNTNEIGIAGHSLGASAVSEVGQCDTRVKTIVAWDDLTPVKSCTGGGETIPAKYLAPSVPRVPALALSNDYEFNPQPLQSPPNPHMGSNGGGLDGDLGYQQLTGKPHLDSMQVAIRSGTHLTYTYIPYTFPANELGERVASYYTVAWFDRYLKGDSTGYQRLTATTFDKSADTDSIGAGVFDPSLAAQNPLDPTAGNAPYTINGLPVANLVSFYYMSEYTLHDPATGGVVTCLDMRAACPPVAPATP